MYDQSLTLLSKEQIWGNKYDLEVMRKYGRTAAITDLCILTGGHVSNDMDYNIDEDSSLKGKTGWFWTKSNIYNNYVCGVDLEGRSFSTSGYRRTGNVRPVLDSPEDFL